MRSEGNTGAHVGGGDVTVSTDPVVYAGRDELGDRHFHDLDNLGACRVCDYGHKPTEPAERKSFESSHKEEPGLVGAYDYAPEPVDQEPEEVVELPDYIMAIALVMRDTEGHPDRAVRAARKVVVTALQGLDRVLRASTSPTRIDATPPDHIVDQSAARCDVCRAVGEVGVSCSCRATTRNGAPRKRRANLTDTEKAELKARYENGESTTQLGRAFGMSATGVGNALRKLGTAMRDRGGRNAA